MAGGGGFFVSGSGGDEEREGDHEGHAVQWVGSASVKGPKWGKLPLLTIGMLGIQCVWSIEMGYASPYLLELGLSKSHMSLVFMAGPLSGLIVQPLVGVFADRSRSKWGRRRPFMIAGCLICAFAMMLLGWAPTISGWFGAGDGLAVGLAVWAIYLIDFSINAVMSTDRALVVDTLPPAQQEEGSAWGGRMFGFGSVLGFFVLDYGLVIPWRFPDQDSVIHHELYTTHHTLFDFVGSLGAGTSARRSQSNFVANMKAIWDNMFTLPPGIQTVCIIQFFNFLAWFPILFFTSVWVSEIYTASVPSEGIDEKTFTANAVRAGNRALFLQALVTIAVGIAAPFLVAESGVQAASTANEYASLRQGEGDDDDMSTPMRKFTIMARAGGLKGLLGDVYRMVKEGTLFKVPVQGLTLVKLWSGSMVLFAFAMACTWFTSTVGGAYFVISLTGVSWALTNWAPYSLLGELILIDGQIDRTGAEGMQLQPVRHDDEHDEARRFSLGDDDDPPPDYEPPRTTRTLAGRSNPASASHSRSISRNSVEVKALADGQTPSPTASGRLPQRATLPTPLRLKLGPQDDDENDTSLVLRHSADDEDEDDQDEIGDRAIPPRSPRSPLANTRSGDGRSTAEKAGIILGIHNVYVVLPQFVVTAMASVIFKIMEPERERGVPASHPQAGPAANSTAGAELGHGPSPTDVAADIGVRVVRGLAKRAEGAIEGGSSDAVGFIFRIGGLSAAIGAVVCWRLAKRWERGQGI